ncbi:hypothetical protein BDW02DRAFT_129225 [Decorospora gaudefroyi]|uniref:C2H2-type domain-containing protein n=1 Tax=Decorospora gaudefroyi TaxID=184978 RepID=A0A6A5KK32_9PLEO|nr:hypothetical protein BDW02DRAFT_129225 [Decorospora gaudefroyi]
MYPHDVRSSTMDAHQFGDLPQIQAMDDTRFTAWPVDSNHYVQPYKQHVVNYRTADDIYFDHFDNGTVSMQPMQRFMVDQSPFTLGMLHAKMPLDSRFESHYEQQWPSSDFYRNVSPDRTSADSSQNAQDEIRSPHAYDIVPYRNPMEYSQISPPYSSIEHLQGGFCSPDTPVFEGNICLRELEYEPEPEPIIEEVEDVSMKQETTCDHEHGVVKMEATSEYKSYADSAIGLSVRDAQSVEPVDFPEDIVSDDSDYSPRSSRSGKRTRSSASNSSTGRAQKRRGHARKDSGTGSSVVSTRTQKRARATSNASRCATDTNIQGDDRRPFPCPLATYGCPSVFRSKNEWKRHVSTQHIKLRYWRCDLCPPSTDPNDDQTLYYNDFNRKDLFAQHLRRMHAAPKDTSSRNQKHYPVTEDNLNEHQTRCNLSLRNPPQHSSCLFCIRTFEGPSSWDECMEHVGRHLEKDRTGCVDMLDPSTWVVDQRLEKYLVEEGLVARDGDAWRISDGKPRRGVVVDDDVVSGED